MPRAPGQFSSGRCRCGDTFRRGSYPDLTTERLMPEEIIPIAAPSLAAASELRTTCSLAPCSNTIGTSITGYSPTGLPGWQHWASANTLTHPPFRRRQSVIQAAVSGLGVALCWHSPFADDVRPNHWCTCEPIIPSTLGYDLVIPKIELRWRTSSHSGIGCGKKQHRRNHDGEPEAIFF